MSTQPTVDQLVKMMEFCGDYSIVIPSYNLPLPEEISPSQFRSEKVFRLLRSGIMNYAGTNGYPRGNTQDVYIGGIKMQQAWIDRTYIFLVEKVKKRLNEKVGRNDSQMEHIKELLLRFGGCEFVIDNLKGD